MIGASAGGITALPRLLAQLPASFPATVVIVMHLGQRERGDTELVKILQRTSMLPVQWADQGGRLEHGHIYIAPPDTHLTIADNHFRLTNGPRENFARPSIDRAMRSAAAQYGSRAVGILLTGMMDDGVAGLLAINHGGGVTIVQDPSDAEFNELPTRALAMFEPGAVLKLEAIPSTLLNVVEKPVQRAAVPTGVLLEAELDALGTVSPREMDQLGGRVQQICPDCGGPLWQIGEPRMRRWRCYLGHVHGARQMLDAGNEQLEAALWSAVRALHERAATWETLAQDARQEQRDLVATEYATKAREARDQAELARRFMLDLLLREP